MRIAFIGFGEAAQAFQESLAAHDSALSFCAYDILLEQRGPDEEMREKMACRGVRVAETPAGLCEADWIISAVTADQSLRAVEMLAPHLSQGCLVVDINSVSPERKRGSAILVERKGSAYLDMAVMAAVHPRGHRTPVLVAGPSGNALRPDLDRVGFDYEVVGAEIGAATAIKMVRSLFVKGLEAITVESLLAAEASGCLETIVQSLARDFSGLGWPDFAAYQFERTLRHGRRRAAEMRECAATVEDLGLNGALAAQIADVQDRMGRALAAAPRAASLSTEIRDVLRARLAGDPRNPASGS
jgi:3-hydroxyisobutyrate dehydrogenase-like beta-hydroxyacid dehydrogenase